jgi:Flp pilus assembly protein TadG
MPKPSDFADACREAVARFRDASGSVAVAFIIALIPMIIMIGAAIDYHRAAGARVRLQAAVDAATLAGAKESTADARIKAARNVLMSNVGELGVSGVAPDFHDNADGTFTGVVGASAPTAFMGIVNVKTIGVSASSRVGLTATPASTPTSLTFTAKGATGWFWKKVTLWIHHPGDVADTAVATFEYQPTTLNARGSGNTSGPLGTPINLGSNYDNLYLTMEVSPDGCAPGYAPLHPDAIDSYNTTYWDPYTCLPEGVSGVVKRKSTYTMSTSDPTTSNHLFVDGVQRPLGTTLNITNMAKCDATVSHSWEDTEIYEAGSSAWVDQDFLFDVKAGSCAANPAMLSTTKAPRLLQ